MSEITRNPDVQHTDKCIEGMDAGHGCECHGFGGPDSPRLTLGDDQWEPPPGVVMYRDGDAWCATGPGFTNIEESPCGFGATKREAVGNLLFFLRKVKRPFRVEVFHVEGAHVVVVRGDISRQRFGEVSRSITDAHRATGGLANTLAIVNVGESGRVFVERVADGGAWIVSVEDAWTAEQWAEFCRRTRSAIEAAGGRPEVVSMLHLSEPSPW